VDTTSRFETTPPVIDRRKKPPLVASQEGLVALVTAVRWGTTTLGMLWATALHSEATDIALGVVLLAYALWRTFRPIEYSRRGWRSLTSIVFELAVTVSVIVATGCWDSPYIFALFTPTIAAGFARGFWHAFRIAVTSAIAVGSAAYLRDLDSGIRPVTAWGGELLLVAAVASYGWRLLRRAEEASAQQLSALWRLNEANSLLVGLNRLAQNLPVSFDLQDTMDNALSRIRDATSPDRSLLMLLDPIPPHWHVALADGVRVPEAFNEELLPSALATIAHNRHPTVVELGTNLGTAGSGLDGFDVSSRSAIYVPLWTGDRQVGLLAVESSQPGHFSGADVSFLGELAESIALTIDNARWFDRLRARGATQERTRIARDLHDRVGQGIAYVAFELDRLSQRASDTELGDDLTRLRDESRSMVNELRETLYDLRVDVTQDNGLTDTIQEFLDRVSHRSGMHTSLTHSTTRRLPLARESEVWRICQEAIVNAERHADATAINVRWDLNDVTGMLEVRDDGVGLQVAAIPADGEVMNYGESPTLGRPAYGITGMRERADAIGAFLEIVPAEHGGTLVRLTLRARSPQVSNNIEGQS
jgi:signal transduction histidine kinase